MTLDYTKPPFGVTGDVKSYKEIRALLAHSTKLQKNLRISNACSKVCVVLHHCLKTMGINHRMVYGVNTYDEVDIKTAHVWIVVDEQVIDNTYVEDIPEDLLSKMKSGATYLERNPADDPGVFLGDKESAERGIPKHVILQP